MKIYFLKLTIDKAISMMRGKSPPPEEIYKTMSNNSLVFTGDLSRERI